MLTLITKSTMRYDLAIKLPRYKSLPGVQHILLVNPDKPGVSMYSRTHRPGQWLNFEVTDVENGYVTIERKRLRLADIYTNVEVE